MRFFIFMPVVVFDFVATGVAASAGMTAPGMRMIRAALVIPAAMETCLIARRSHPTGAMGVASAAVAEA